MGDMKGQTWLVTGGAGFIGANFILMHRRRDIARIVNLDSLTYAGNPESLSSLADDDGHIFVQGDIGDKELVRELLGRHRPRAVINFAAESHVDRSILGPIAFAQTNVLGTLNLLEAVREYWNDLAAAKQAEFRFLQVSTDEVYGSLKIEDPAFSELSLYRPNSPYAASKASADHFVRAYYHTYGLPTLTTNCSNNYGPLQFPEKLIPLMVLNALDGKRLPIYGDGMQIRDWIYVEDHCEGVALVLEHGQMGETYNIGGNAELPNMEVVQALCRILDEIMPHSPHCPHVNLIEHVTDRPGHDRRYAIDANKIREELGWRPRESFASGIRKTVQWYLDNRDWVENVRSGVYQDWIHTNYGHRLEKGA